MSLMDNWQQVKLGDAAVKVGSGATPRGGSDSYHSAGTPLIRSQNVRSEGFTENGLVFLNQEQSDALKGVDVKTGDVLLNITGASIGRVAIAPASMDGARVNQHVCIIRPTDGLNGEFLCRFLSTPWMQHFIMRTQSGATRQALTKEKILDFDVPLPPMAEQFRIVSKVRELRDRARASEQALSVIPSLLEQFRQSVLAAAFRGDLTADWRRQNPDVEPASALLDRIRTERRQRWEEAHAGDARTQGKRRVTFQDWRPQGNRSEVASQAKSRVSQLLPASWALAYLGEVAQLQPGFAFKSSWFEQSGTRLLRGVNISPGKVRWDDTVHLDPRRYDEFNDYQMLESDIVIAMDRPLISTGLKVARVSAVDLPSLLLQRVGRFKHGADILGDYLFWFLQSQTFISHIDVQATGTQLPHISKNDIETAPLSVPPIAEQQAIVFKLNEIFERYRQVGESAVGLRQTLATLSQSILAKAFRGELVPQDPNDEPASVLLQRIRAEREANSSGGNSKKRKSK